MILYWLRILSKTYISRIFRIHYSQFGEDVILREFIKKQKKDFMLMSVVGIPKDFLIRIGCIKEVGEALISTWNI